MNKRRKSGFSIMETVIALAVIVLVTAAALSVVMASISSRIKQSNYSEAQDFAHNILECFKAAAPAVALPGEIDPLGVAEFVAHEGQVALAAQAHGQQTQQLV